MTFTASGTLASSSSTGNTTIGLTGAAVGNVFALMIKVNSASITVTSVSGAGAAWSRAAGPWTDNAGSPFTYEIWLGTVTTATPGTAVAVFSSSVSSVLTAFDCQQFTSSLGTAAVWGTDVSGHLNNASSTTITYPALTPSSGAELYFGHCGVASGSNAGSTPGCVYQADVNGDQIVYDLSTTATLQPTAIQSSSGQSWSFAALITDQAGSTVPPPSPTVQPSAAVVRASIW